MAGTGSGFAFSAEMFEQALEAEAWKPMPDDRPKAVEASEQLSMLAGNVASYAPASFPSAEIGEFDDTAEAIEQPDAALDFAFNAEAVAQSDAGAPSEAGAPPEPITHWRLERPGDLFAVFRPDCPTTYLEQFQLLRTQLLLLRAQCASDDDFRCVCITSARSGEGKTFTARNLAATLAIASGKRVLLVETEKRETLIPKNVLGLDSALAQPEHWRRSAAEIETSSLSVLAGPGGMEQTDFEPLPALIARLKPHFDWIVLDAPAVENSAAAEWVAASADAALVVVRQGDTPFDSLSDAVSRIPRGRLAGVVMNRVPAKKRRSWLPKVRIKWSRRAS